MKATKLMALGLVGLTTLGLAATANAEDATESAVKTQASVTFSTGSESGNQEGPNGEVAPGNPIDETPSAVNGWKLAVPSVLKFIGKDSTLEQQGDVTKTVYNPSTTTNDYVSEGVKNADGTITPFFLRFETDGENVKEGTFKVSVERDQFKVNDQVLDVDSKGSYINIPKFQKINSEEGKDLFPVVSELTSESVKLITANPKEPSEAISSVKLVIPEDGSTQGFVNVGTNDAITLHIATQSNTLKNLSRATVTTNLTWTFAAETPGGQ